MTTVGEIARLLSRCSETPGGCWEWQGARLPKGYGRIAREDGRVVYTHRLSYEFFMAPIPAGLTIDHLCHNPPCVNPWHMDPVPQAVNSKRMGKATALACPRGHLYGDYRRANGRRRCLTCQKIMRAARVGSGECRWRYAQRVVVPPRLLVGSGFSRPSPGLTTPN